jgi:hypothetical protein
MGGTPSISYLATEIVVFRSKKRNRNAPTPWISSWMTSVLLEGVCHSRSALVGMGVEIAVAMLNNVLLLLATF